MNIFDSHMHVSYKGFSTDDLILYMDSNGVAACWLLTWEELRPAVPSVYHRLSIEDVFAAYRKYPDRIIPMYAPDPRDPLAAEKLTYWADRGVRGCGELKVPLNWASSELDPLLARVAELRMPVVFHMSGPKTIYVPDSGNKVDFLLARLLSARALGAVSRRVMAGMADIWNSLKKKIERFERFFPGYLIDFAALGGRLESYRHVNFVGHGPLFWAGISEGLRAGEDYPGRRVTGEGITCRLLSEHDNLYADLSGRSGFNALARDIPFARRFLSKYRHKILYGTDNLHHLGLKRLLDSLNLSEEISRSIYRENAERLVANLP